MAGTSQYTQLLPSTLSTPTSSTAALGVKMEPWTLENTPLPDGSLASSFFWKTVHFLHSRKDKSERDLSKVPIATYLFPTLLATQSPPLLVRHRHCLQPGTFRIQALGQQVHLVSKQFLPNLFLLWVSCLFLLLSEPFHTLLSCYLYGRVWLKQGVYIIPLCEP